MMAKSEEMQDRSTEFAVAVMTLCEKMPKTFAGRHVGEQLFRAATSAAANYAEVRAAESRNDFIHKLGIVRKELFECLVWLKISERRSLGSTEAILPLLSECDQLCRIITVSKKTAEANARRESRVE